MQKAIMFVTATLLISAAFATAQTGADLLQQAQNKMQDADFEGAIQIYDRILRESGADSVITASARIDRAMAKRMLARIEAVKEYKEIGRTYADQPAVAEYANKRMTEIAFEPGVYVAEFDSTAGKIHAPVARLTALSSTEQFPLWSPDGESLSLNRHAGQESTIVVRHITTRRDILQSPQGFQMGPAFWTAEGDGVLSLRLSGDPIVSPPSPFPAYRRSLGDSLERIDLEGKAHQLSRLGVAVYRFQSTVSRDGKFLYVNSFTGSGNFITGNIIAFDIVTGQQKQVFSLPAGKSATTSPGGPAAGRYISISPDGNAVAVIRRPPNPDACVALVSTNGDGYREIVTDAGTLRTVAWTRDSRSILFTKLKPNTDDTWLLMQIPIKGGEAVFTGLEITGLSYLDVSPDGSRIAFDGTGFQIQEQPR